jgi:hypothetical protein
LPELLVVAVRVTLVATLCTVIVAFATTAPELSLTSPEMLPVMVWANKVEPQTAKIK